MATQHINFNIQGMTCQACANRIEKVLNKKEFVSEAVVNFAGETAQITFDDTQTNPDELIKIIEKTGFQAAVQTSLLPETDSHESHWRVWTLLALSLPFWVGMLGMLGSSHALMPPLWLQIAIATVAQTYFALPFYKGAVASVRGGLANMDVLVSVGTLSIYLYSLGMVLAGHAHHVYFEAGVMVLAFVSLGKYLEAKTKRGSLNALGSLLQLTPRDVQILQNNQWQTVKIDQVKQGDILRCVQGGRIAADGEVVSGEGWWTKAI